ncbi:MAG: hypothetical protein IKK27_05220 [Alistipes sp.]|nr:hypothetical protein [Alistipes sp.]
MKRRRVKIAAVAIALGVMAYFVWLLVPSLFTRDSNLLVTLFLLGNAVGCLFSAKYLYRKWRERER